LQSAGTGAIDVVVAVITAEGEIKMNDVPENATNSQVSAQSGEPIPAKRYRVAASARNVAPSRGKSRKQADRPLKPARARSLLNRQKTPAIATAKITATIVIKRVFNPFEWTTIDYHAGTVIRL
jgi:hypothetical protein